MNKGEVKSGKGSGLMRFPQGEMYEVRHKKVTSRIAREPRVGGEKQTDGYRICSDLSQCYKAQLDRFTQYKWTHLQI